MGQSGRFTQISKIIKTVKTSKSILLTVGDSIDCPHLNTTAIIRSVGIPAFDKTQSIVHFGVELLKPCGNCNGEIYSAYLGKKMSYFKCKEEHGLYVKESEVCIVYKPENTNDEVLQLKELIKYKQSEYEKVMKEFAEYKQETEEDNDRMEMENRLKVLKEGNKRLTMRIEQIATVNKEYENVNSDLKQKYEELEVVKISLKEKEDENGKYDALLKEFNEYKTAQNNDVDDDKKENVDALKLEIK